MPEPHQRRALEPPLQLTASIRNRAPEGGRCGKIDHTVAEERVRAEQRGSDLAFPSTRPQRERRRIADALDPELASPHPTAHLPWMTVRQRERSLTRTLGRR